MIISPLVLHAVFLLRLIKTYENNIITSKIKVIVPISEFDKYKTDTNFIRKKKAALYII